MWFNVGLILATLTVGSLALPAQKPNFPVLDDHSDSSSRIVGGTVAGAVPYMAALTVGNRLRSFLCGSSLITNRHMLTAAHCVEAVFDIVNDQLPSTLRGTVATNRWNSGGISYQFSSNITHPNYVDATVKNDISLLITTTNVALSSAVQLVALNYDWIEAGIATKISGWGRTRNGGPLSNVLMELLQVTVDAEQCVDQIVEIAAIYDMSDWITHVEPHLELCTFQAFNHGFCYGDSGSPLLRTDLNEQIGIASWGAVCALGAPDVHVRISVYKDWILQNIA